MPDNLVLWDKEVSTRKQYFERLYWQEEYLYINCTCSFCFIYIHNRLYENNFLEILSPKCKAICKHIVHKSKSLILNDITQFKNHVQTVYSITYHELRYIDSKVACNSGTYYCYRGIRAFSREDGNLFASKATRAGRKWGETTQQKKFNYIIQKLSGLYIGRKQYRR